MQRRKRKITFNTPGHAHLLTFSTYHKIKFLTDDDICRSFLASVDNARLTWEFELWAYVIMPDHAHLVVWPTREECDVADILKAVKQPVAQAAVRQWKDARPDLIAKVRIVRPNGRVEHRFWQQGGGHDRNFGPGDKVGDCIDYVHANPVVAGLCERDVDWPWSSAAWYAGLRDIDCFRVDTWRGE